MRKILAAAASSVVAFAVFAGEAHASATIDLIWKTSGTNEANVSNPNTLIELEVILTAGPNGSEAGGVSVDFSSAGGKPVVFGALNTPSEGFDSPLPLTLGLPLLGASRVEFVNAICLCDSGIGVGLEAGESQTLGIVTFYLAALLDGTYEILSDAEYPGDAVLDGDGNEIPKEEITFNSASLIISRTIYQAGPKKRHKSP